jgi:demethylmenaquinone methyltransferase/2-methoxy-6-polyprenyl-1,4-benzoquinol methylase/phosphoethanolamine N-methyltransferase
MDTLHGHGQGPGEPHGHGHSHGTPPGHSHGQATPATTGRLIRWARIYEPLLKIQLLGQTGALRALPLDLAALRPGERVLDIGCGPGELTLAAWRRVGPTGAVAGIDASPEMIAEARRKARRIGRGVEFRVEPVEALSFPAGSFDVVLSSLMMHHLPGDLKGRALAEVGRVLRPGGRIVIVDLQPTDKMPRLWEPGWLVARLHKRQPHAAASLQPPGAPLAALLREAGFTTVEHGPTRFGWVGYARGQAPE